ncbi:hypothetical protein GF359_06690, partial [candidate division WOR-3 bacterium]|nr:hypothetical protein [candidate division WOR-3 bacterium]MBD3364885.1 hypothetical protein [candidate division WOR-3 bacterium]
MSRRIRSTTILCLVAGILGNIYANWEILDLPTDRGFGAIWAIDEQNIFVSGHQGLWKTFDGIEWVMDTGYQTSCIYFVDDTLGFLGGYYITTDGGKTWQKGDTINGGVGSISFPKDESLIGYGTGYDDVRKTTDGCWHWQILPPLPEVYPDAEEETNPYRISFPSNPDTGYVTAQCTEWIPIGGGEYDYFPRQSYFKTTDGGETWDTVLKDLPHIASISFPETDQVGYVFGDSLAHKTTDGGKTWKVAYFTHDSIWGHSHFLNNRVGFVTGKVVSSTLSLYYPY